MRSRQLCLLASVALMMFGAAARPSAQRAADRVRGEPGAMSVRAGECRTQPTPDVRSRIVDLALQEWTFFGSRISDPAEVEDDPPLFFTAGRRPRLTPAEAARVAPSIAGYWAVTPEGAWIVARQNDRWKGDEGVAARWNAPWSAAFISWVMCEAGLGTTALFQRAIAHHAYIDQAIRARDGRAPGAAFRTPGGGLRVEAFDQDRPVFAHLKLRAAS